MLLSDVLREYVAVRLFDSSPHSIRIHEYGLAHFGEFLQQPARTGHLTDAQVGAWVRWMIDVKKLSRPSVRMYRNRLCALWRFAARRNWTAIWPELPPVKMANKIPVALTVDQIRSLWRATRKLQGNIGGIPQGGWFRGLISFAWCSGERRAAMLALRMEDVRLDVATAMVRGEDRKGGIETRLYDLSPECVESFAEIWKPERRLVLPFPHCTQTYYNRFRDLLDVAGLPVSKDYMTHVLRRSFGTHVKANGGDATEALGHSGPKVTTDSYIDPSICKGAVHWKLLPRLDEPEPPRAA